RFSLSGETERFVPANPLAETTLYTVTVKAGLRAAHTEDVLLNDAGVRLETGLPYGEGRQSAYFSRTFVEFRPGTENVFSLSVSNVSLVGASVFRFSSATAFIDSVKRVEPAEPWMRYRQKLDEAALTAAGGQKIFSSTSLPLEKGGTSQYYSFLRVPQALDQGFYAILVDSGKNKGISWFQVHPSASFAAFASEQSLVWLKDTASGAGLSGVLVSYEGRDIGKTGSDGVALFPSPTEFSRGVYEPYHYPSSGRRFLVAKVPLGELVIPVESEYGSTVSLTSPDRWWDYIGLNKNIYLPTDTVRFFAIARERDQDARGEVTATLSNSYWYYDETTDITTYAEVTLPISEFGGVTGELSFSGLRPGYYQLTLKKGEEIIGTQGVTVQTYLKPAYKVTVVPRTSAVFAGEPATFDVKAEFFDGTPLSGAVLSYLAYHSGPIEGAVTLNAEGEGSFTFIPGFLESYRYWPSYIAVQVRPMTAEEGEIAGSGFMYLFGPKVSNTVREETRPGSALFSILTRAVVIPDGPRGDPYWDTEEYLGAPVPRASTDIAIDELVFVKEERGRGYDPINKLSYPIYEYRTEERPLSTKTITADEKGEATFSYPVEAGKMYKFVFTTSDASGRVAIEERYVYGRSEADSRAEDQYYSLFNRDRGRGCVKNYAVGESVNLLLRDSRGGAPADGPSKYIFLTVRNGRMEYLMQNSPEYRGVFRDGDIPNVAVWPGWFSDGRFHNAYLENLSFDADGKRLSILVTADKPSYKPGDTVALDVRVTDRAGKPVKAEVNLSALDEAVFSIRPEERDVVEDLYRDIYSPVSIRTSHLPPYGGGGAEKGGGGDDGARSDIREVALFRSVVTDGSGRARVEFILPDNVTSWRITSQAITKDLSAGKDTSFVKVTLPFFVDATLNRTYLAGDSLVLRLRTFGTDVGSDTVKYTAESPTLPFTKVAESGTREIHLPLGVLTFGEHELTARAESPRHTDAIARPLSVLETYFTTRVSDYYQGEPGVGIKNSAKGYTTLTFGSAGRGLLYTDLDSLRYERGIRLDQAGARVLAADLLREYFGEDHEGPAFPSDKYQSGSGGLRLLPHGSEELELSALGAHLFPEDMFDRESLKRYLARSLVDEKADTGRIVRALYGLTAFKEPVLMKLERLKDERSLSTEERIFLALALDALGAKEASRAYYRKSIVPAIETRQSYAYVGGLRGDDTALATALLSALAASLSEPEAAALRLYTTENRPRETLVNLERLLYTKTVLPKLDDAPVGFRYRTPSAEGTKTLKNGELFSIAVSPQDLASFALSDVTGAVGIVASYDAASSPQSLSKDNNLSLFRSYEVGGRPTRTFAEGDTVMVRLTPGFSANALEGAYQIVDYLPSGLRALDREAVEYDGYRSRAYPSEIADQRVTFVTYNPRYLDTPQKDTYYYARVVSKGTYKAEPALLQSLSSLDSLTVSDEASVTIR
ncbi:MAG: alpha-2-macroglobulin family protein, partial [Patescibacteria group bacterium]